MTKSEFNKEFAKIAKISKPEATYLTNKFIACLKAVLLEGEEVNFSGLGVIKVNTRKPKRVRHPATKIITIVPERKVPFLAPSLTFMQELNKDRNKKGD